MASPVSSAPTRDQIAGTLASASGLDHQVAYNWLAAENSHVGHGTNPLGILCGNSKGSGLEIGCAGRFAVYRSVFDGAKAAAWLLAHGSHYGGVRVAIAGGSPAQQRAAIVNSGWAAGNYGGGAGFSAGNLPAGTNVGYPPSSVRPGGSQGNLNAGSAPAGSTVTQDTLKGLGIDATPGHMLTDADIWKITMKATGQDPGRSIDAGNSIYQGYLANLRGKTVAQMSSDYAAGTTYQAPDPITAVANAIGAIPGQLVALVIPGAVLIALLWVGKVGLEKVLGGPGD